jgi:uncharacterized protein YecE (DUF72 family)
VAAPIRVGTCSWADETLSKVWYPKGVRSGEERLRHYAERFDVVEANSTFYRLPDEQMVSRWAERTPDGFTMHVKAFGAMTRHPVKLDVLPPELRDVPTDDQGRVERPPREWRAEVFRVFSEVLEPLRAAGKLGGILLQFPPYIVFKPYSFDYLEWCRGQLPEEDLLIEFRHHSWFEEDTRAETLGFLERHGLTHVIVDAPRTRAKNVIPTVPAVTSETAYVRFHGRNAKTWNIRSRSAAERFDYLYSVEELEEWVEPLRELAGEAANVYAMFNNNGRSPRPELEGLDPAEAAGDPEGEWVAQAPANALMLKGLLARAGVTA